MHKYLISGLAMLAGVGMAQAQEFDLNALIEAARAEPPLTVYDSTGKITEMTDGFAAKYGLKATGTKTKATAQLETIIREVQSGNVQTDVSFISDVPAVKVSMQDPLGKPSYTDWFNQMRSHADDRIAAAYAAQYGKPLETSYDSATEAFVAALAANGPLLTDSDSNAAEAVAAPGQSQPFVGIVSAAKFRDNAGAGFTLGLCSGVDPIIGFSNATVGLIVTGTDSPNAAKLFIHYAMTAEGIAPQAEDGKVSSNRTVGLPADEPSGIAAHLSEVLAYDPSTGMEDWDTRQDWQDFWRLNYAR